MDAILFWIVAAGKRLLGNIASPVHLGIGRVFSFPCGSTFLELFCWSLVDLSALNYHRFDFFALLATTTHSLWPLELLRTTIFLKRKRIFWNFGKSWMLSSRACASQRTNQGLKCLFLFLSKRPKLTVGKFCKIFFINIKVYIIGHNFAEFSRPSNTWKREGTGT